jgi:hypothetical protein
MSWNEMRAKVRRLTVRYATTRPVQTVRNTPRVIQLEFDFSVETEAPSDPPDNPA